MNQNLTVLVRAQVSVEKVKTRDMVITQESCAQIGEESIKILGEVMVCNLLCRNVCDSSYN